MYPCAQDKTRTCTNLIVHYPLKVACLPISPPGQAVFRTSRGAHTPEKVCKYSHYFIKCKILRQKTPSAYATAPRPYAIIHHNILLAAGDQPTAFVAGGLLAAHHQREEAVDHALDPGGNRVSVNRRRKYHRPESSIAYATEPDSSLKEQAMQAWPHAISIDAASERRTALPPRSEYDLTPLGRSLIPIIDAMIEWGSRNSGLFHKKYDSMQP